MGSPFLWLLSFGEAKESESPAGAKSRLRPQTKRNVQINGQEREREGGRGKSQTCWRRATSPRSSARRRPRA
ncbi:hypothetical protein EJI01_09885 [Variovorax sp. MHTC-1]|nr:hypothetical protein EJI01_09885 [Variovorax sp. MHTC-1]